MVISFNLNIMENKEYNGFASEAQYEAVFNAVKKAIVEFDSLDYFAVYYWDERISVQLGTGLSLVIQYDHTIQEIECDYPFNMFEVEMIEGIYECTDDIWTAFEQYQPKEQSV